MKYEMTHPAILRALEDGGEERIGNRGGGTAREVNGLAGSWLEHADKESEFGITEFSLSGFPLSSPRANLSVNSRG